MPATHGYSGKSLAAKLGIRPGTRLAAIAAPTQYETVLSDEIAGVFLSRYAEAPDQGLAFTIVHLFVDRAATLTARLPCALAAVEPGGALWISWPKKSSKLFIDVTDQTLRDFVLPYGFVDIKVAAVDTDWSALKFVRRAASSARKITP
jgi:hypothetical protein